MQTQLLIFFFLPLLGDGHLRGAIDDDDAAGAISGADSDDGEQRNDSFVPPSSSFTSSFSSSFEQRSHETTDAVSLDAGEASDYRSHDNLTPGATSSGDRCDAETSATVELAECDDDEESVDCDSWDPFATSTPNTSVISATSHSPHAPIKINNHQSRLFLFDTGARDSILSVEILHSMGIKGELDKTSMKLEGLAGGGLNILGKIHLDCTIHDVTFRVPFMVVLDHGIAIFGLDNMKKFDIQIDVAAGTLISNNYNNCRSGNDLSEEKVKIFYS